MGRGISVRVRKLIKNLLDSGKSILAVKFMYECGMSDEFESIPVLRSYIKDSREAAVRVCKEESYYIKSQNKTIDKEVDALKAAIKIIKDQNLESEFTQEKVEERVEELEKFKALRKRDTTNSSQQELQKRVKSGLETAMGHKFQLLLVSNNFIEKKVFLCLNLVFNAKCIVVE